MHRIGHRLDDTRIVIGMIDDFGERFGIPQGLDVLPRRSGDEKMIVQNPGPDPPGVNTNVQNIFGDVERPIGQMFGNTPRFLENRRARR
ncbi:hypothetical protein ACF1BQ_020585 [Bradyrhizobium sp. RDT10]